MSELTLFRCWFCHSCLSVLQLADDVDRSGQEVHLDLFFKYLLLYASQTYQPSTFACHMTTCNSGSNLSGNLQREQSAACRKTLRLCSRTLVWHHLKAPSQSSSRHGRSVCLSECAHPGIRLEFLVGWPPWCQMHRSSQQLRSAQY